MRCRLCHDWIVVVVVGGWGGGGGGGRGAGGLAGLGIYFLCTVDYAMTGLVKRPLVSFQTMYIGHVKRSHVLRLPVLSVRLLFPSSVARSSLR